MAEIFKIFLRSFLETNEVIINIKIEISKYRVCFNNKDIEY